MKEQNTLKRESRMAEAAKQMTETYERERWYEDMEFDEYIRMEADTCDPATHDAIFGDREDKEQALQEFIHLCNYQFK